MTETELPPMASGGEWLHSGGSKEPLYVTHEAHVKRLLSEGWRPVADPRKPMEAKPVQPSKEEALMAQLAAALARIDALESAQQAPSESSPASAVPADDDQATRKTRK
ncbi:MAG: hypothetical protein ACRDHZ_02410 [Ktedonobacteraceae bacterium]